MRSSLYLLGFLALIAVGCSSSQTKSSDTGSKTTAVATPPAAASPAEKKGNEDAVMCTHGKESRSLKIEVAQPKGCKLWYSSFSKEKPVATSANSEEHCKTVRDRIQKKLETAGYKCAAE
jgi:hypothetical protein